MKKLVKCKIMWKMVKLGILISNGKIATFYIVNVGFLLDSKHCTCSEKP